MDMNIPKDGFEFADREDKIREIRFQGRPNSYAKDAWIRFRKNRASIVAAIIIVLLVLYALLAPVFITHHTGTSLDVTYAKKPPRVLFLRNTVGIADGGSVREFSEKSLIKAIAVGVGAENRDGKTNITIADGMKSEYQPVLAVRQSYESGEIRGQQAQRYYSGRIDNYLEVGFQHRSIRQEEFEQIRAWERETGLQVLYPLIENNEYNLDHSDANNWYKTLKGVPVQADETGQPKKLRFSQDLVLQDNYRRDTDGEPVYFEYTGGGTAETAQYKVRVLYYNYYRYQNGFEPEYLLGTDSQGHDLALRMAGGLRLSLLLAVCVCAINLTLGTVYGAVEGYYGGTTDIVMERAADILSGVPFVVVATLFQIHLAGRVGAIPSLLFAFVLTGWLSTAGRVRTQFYRFKGQEYVLAARTLGARDRRIIWKHIFPNALGTVITASVLVIPGTINTESTLSYLGIVKLSTQEYTSLGNLLADASGIWTNYPHLLLFPALTLSILLICFNLLGNGLRDAFNPSLRDVEE